MSDELSTALRELAVEQETRPVLTGAEIRGRAGRRARRRMAGTLGAGAVALALVASAVTLGFTDFRGFSDPAGEGKPRQLPAATTPAVPSPRVTSGKTSAPEPRAPVTGTVALGKRALFVGDRVMPLTSSLPDSPKVVGPLTVYKKHTTKVVTVTVLTAGAAYTTEVSLAVELRDVHGEPVYVGLAFSYKGDSYKEGNGKDTGARDAGGGWIGLDSADAKWFYDNAKIGSVLSVTGSSS
ncbi:hypothetical protein OG223_28315 [Streptomyces sp. NBC_01478]|uniref:hypothetical protein n=1 Tax=Streptomyces sp. NBC_01478 TaxID=2903882 RepID=UPI002E32A751|nr:hypothetical protein [Streptomyces sp. NBC_01478]